MPLFCSDKDWYDQFNIIAVITISIKTCHKVFIKNIIYIRNVFYLQNQRNTCNRGYILRENNVQTIMNLKDISGYGNKCY